MDPEAPPTPAVGYIRVSKEREEMISPETQKTYIENFANRERFRIVKWLYDIDKSGRDFTKRRVEEMVQGVHSGEWQAAILWKWSRWGRNLQESTLFMAQFEQAGGEVRAATEDYDRKTMMGKFNSDLQLLLAELESNKISESWKDSHESRRRRGLPHTGAPRIGYTYDKATGYTVDPKTAPIVKQAYEDFLAGRSSRTIAIGWNEIGFKTMRGKSWSAASVSDALDTGFSAGLIRERSTQPTKARKARLRDFDIWREGAHEAIIDMETWERYKAKRLANAQRPPRLVTVSWPLSGLMRCGAVLEDGSTCNATLTSHYRKNRSHTWYCWRADTAKEHQNLSVSNRLAEQRVLEWIVEELDVAERVEEDSERYRAAQKFETDVNAISDDLKRLTAQRSRLADLAVEGAIEIEDYKRKKAEISEQIESAERSLARAKEEVENASTPIAPMLRTLADAWDHMSVEDKNAALSSFIGRIVVRPGQVKDKITIDPRWSTSD